LPIYKIAFFDEAIMIRKIEKQRKVTPQIAVDVLKKHGTKISLEEAEIILDFMYKMAKLTVENHSKKGQNDPKKATTDL
jgi:hypothetical protein